MYTHTRAYTQTQIDLMVRVFANGPGNRGSIPDRVIPKTQKWNFIPPGLSLSIIRYGFMVSLTIQGKCVAATEKGVFESPSTTVSQLIYIYIYIYHVPLARISLTLYRPSLLPRLPVTVENNCR